MRRTGTDIRRRQSLIIHIHSHDHCHHMVIIHSFRGREEEGDMIMNDRASSTVCQTTNFKLDEEQHQLKVK